MVPKCHPANGASYTTSSDQIYISFSLDRKLLQNFTSGDDNSSHLELLLMNKVLTECLGSLTMAFLAPKENNHMKLKCGNQPSINSNSKFQRNSAISSNRCNKRRKICKSSRENNQNEPLNSQNLEINGYRWDSDADSDVGGGSQSPDENVDITSERNCRSSFDTTSYSISGMHAAPQIPTKLLEFASVQHVVSDLAAAAARDNNNSSPLNLSSRTLNAKNLDNLSSSSPDDATHPQMPVSSQRVVPIPSVTLLREMKKITSSEENVFEIESGSLSSSVAIAPVDDGAEFSSDSDCTSRSDDTAAMADGASGPLIEEDDSVLDVSQENHSLLSPSMLTAASENIAPSKFNKNVLNGQNDDLKGIAVVTPAAAPSGPMFHNSHGGSAASLDSCNNLKLTHSLNELILEGIYGCSANSNRPDVTSSAGRSGAGGNNRHSSSRHQENAVGAITRSSGAAAAKAGINQVSCSSASKDEFTSTASKLLQTAVAAAFLPTPTTTTSAASNVVSSASSNKASGGRNSPPNLKSHHSSNSNSNHLNSSINNNNILLVNQVCSTSSKLSPPSTSPSNSSTSSSGASCNSSVHAVHTTPPQSSSCNSSSTPRRGQKCLVCEFGCGYETPDATLLKSHHVSHSNDRPYQCSYCGHAFKRNHTLLRHIRQVHKIDTTSAATGETVFSVASMVTPQQSVAAMDIKSAAATAALSTDSSCSSTANGTTPTTSSASSSTTVTSNASPSSRAKREAAAVAKTLLRAAAVASNDAGVLDCKLEKGFHSQKRSSSVSQTKSKDFYDDKDEAAHLCIDDDDMDEPMDLAFGACDIHQTGESDSFLDLKPVFNLSNKSCNVLNMTTSGANSAIGKHVSAANNRTAVKNSSSTVKLAATAASLNLVMSM